MHYKKIVQTAGVDNLGKFAPTFAKLNDDILFGQIWNRQEQLSLRDRSLVTIVSLISQGITDSSLAYHIKTAKENGISKQQISEIITHIAFYAGWPKAWAAFNLAKEIYNEPDSLEDFAKQMIFPIGNENVQYAKYFTGKSYLYQISSNVFNVTFEPCCINNWHIHKAKQGGGQKLIGVAGCGYYQQEGQEAVKILPGTIIDIPANVKHWHGAGKEGYFAHLAIDVDGEEKENIWLEVVDQNYYNSLN